MDEERRARYERDNCLCTYACACSERERPLCQWWQGAKPRRYAFASAGATGATDDHAEACTWLRNAQPDDRTAGIYELIEARPDPGAATP
jgi:hypothetical protein